MAEKIPGWIERLLLPRLTALEGELKAVNTRIDGLEKEMSSLRNEMNIKFGAVEKEMASLRNEMVEKMGSLRNEMNTRFDALEEKISLVEDVAKLKMEVKSLAEKLATIVKS